MALNLPPESGPGSATITRFVRAAWGFLTRQALEELDERLEDVEAAISNEWRGEWDAEESYNAGDLVSHNGSTWRASDSIPVASPADEPGGSPTEWELFAAGGEAASGPGSLIGVQVITATGAGTYTPSAGTESIILELQGAGGGGGSVAANPGAGTSNLAIGGSAGAYIWVRLTENFSGASYSVGAKGTGGASGGNNAGTAGGNTTFTDTAGSPTTYTAAGGGAGLAGSAIGPSGLRGIILGGAATNGTLTRSGGPSMPPILLGSTIGSLGGNSAFGQGGQQAAIGTNGSQAGGAATGKGAGGGGAANNGTSASAAGGDGGDGLIRIFEYR
jgi:hypothetical protein